jgi:hypothetical protein
MKVRHDLLCKACTDRGLVCSAKGRIFNNMLYAKYTLDKKPNTFVRDKPSFLSERMLHKDCYRKSSVGKISQVVGLEGWRQDELIGGKPPVIK